MANPLFPKFNQNQQIQKQTQDSLNRIKKLSTSSAPQARVQLMQEAHRLRQSLRGKNRNLDRTLSQLAATAQNNVIQTNQPIRKQVEKALNLLLGTPEGAFLAAQNAMLDALSSKIQNVIQPLTMAEKLIGQLAPEMFGGPAAEPEKIGGVWMDVSQHQTRKVQPDKPDTYYGMRLVDSNTVEIKTSNFRSRYDIDDPEITGKMVSVTSSNVHSIGFQMNLKNPLASTLLVRYLQSASGNSKSKVAGPMYGYSNVHPKLFRQFIIANSKGKFVWDELRIRGIVAGAQYKYTLLQVTGGNVPRRALLVNGIQYLKRRVKQSADGKKTVRSKLGHERLGPYRPTSNRPNRGNPDIGNHRPNRGR